MKIDIKKLAKLANIYLKKEEEEKFEHQLEDTLKYIENLNNIDTSNVLGTNEVVDLENIFREDIVEPSFTQDEALKNAKKTYNGFFIVPSVLSSEMTT